MPITQNSVNSSTFGGLAGISGAKYVKIFGSNLSTGDTDLYTVPSGRKCLVLSGGARVYNPSAGSITWFGQIKVSGTYYRVSSSTTTTTGSSGAAIFLTNSIVLNAGESIAINTTTTAGLNFFANGIEFDSSETRLGTARILSLSSGNNTIYTVPSNKSLLNTSSLSFTGLLAVFNSSGGSLNYVFYSVPSGGSSGSTNQLIPSTAVANNTITTLAMPAMGSGDFIVVNSSGGGAGQVAWFTYFEI